MKKIICFLLMFSFMFTASAGLPEGFDMASERHGVNRYSYDLNSIITPGGDLWMWNSYGASEESSAIKILEGVSHIENPYIYKTNGELWRIITAGYGITAKKIHDNAADAAYLYIFGIDIVLTNEGDVINVNENKLIIGNIKSIEMVESESPFVDFWVLTNDDELFVWGGKAVPSNYDVDFISSPHKVFSNVKDFFPKISNGKAFDAIIVDNNNDVFHFKTLNENFVDEEGLWEKTEEKKIASNVSRYKKDDYAVFSYTDNENATYLYNIFTGDIEKYENLDKIVLVNYDPNQKFTAYITADNEFMVDDVKLLDNANVYSQNALDHYNMVEYNSYIFADSGQEVWFYTPKMFERITTSAKSYFTECSLLGEEVIFTWVDENDLMHYKILTKRDNYIYDISDERAALANVKNVYKGSFCLWVETYDNCLYLLNLKGNLTKIYEDADKISKQLDCLYVQRGDEVFSVSTVGFGSEVLEKRLVFEENPTKPVLVEFKGRILDWYYPIQNKDGRIMYPFRQLCEALGLSAGWREDSEKGNHATAIFNDGLLEFYPDRDYYIDCGTKKYMDTSPYIDPVSERLYVPIRYVAEWMNTVEWIEGNEYNLVKIY